MSATSKTVAVLICVLATTSNIAALSDEPDLRVAGRVRGDLSQVIKLTDLIEADPVVQQTFVGELLVDMAEKLGKHREMIGNAPLIEQGYAIGGRNQMSYITISKELIRAFAGGAELELESLNNPETATLDGEPAAALETYVSGGQGFEATGNSSMTEKTLRQFLRTVCAEVENATSAPLFEAKIFPTIILQSPEIKAAVKLMLAELLTDAQERDGESIGFSAYRNFRNHAFHQALKTVTEDIEEVTAGLRKFEDGYCTELIIKPRRKSNLSDYFTRLGEVRNRSLNWLHPDHDSFLTFCLPLPELVTERLAQLSEANRALMLLAGQDESMADSVTRWEKELAESKQIEWLQQSIPTEGGRTHVVIIPGQSSNELTETAIQLTSSGLKEAWTPFVTTIADCPVHDVTPSATWAGMFFEGLSSLAENNVTYLVPTADCLMLVSGNPEDCLDVAQELIRREFDSPPQVRQYSRTAIAGEFSPATSHTILSRYAVTTVKETSAQSQQVTFEATTSDGKTSIQPVTATELKLSPAVPADVEKIGVDHSPAQPPEIKPQPGFRIALLMEDGCINLRTTFPANAEPVMLAFVSNLYTGIEVISGFTNY